jgi:hypothetical protein
MKRLLFVLYFTVLFLLAFACATYKKQYSKSGRNWADDPPMPSTGPSHVMYLVGDAGNSMPGGSTPVLKYLKTKLPDESKNSSIIFLGDNIYEYGMPPSEDETNREVAEHRITEQLEILDDFKGRPIFLPGNHDWRGWGQKGLKRQENFIESYLNKKRGVEDKDDWENYFLPDEGCSGPEVVELNEEVVVLAVDSQWWLGDSDEEPKINEGCEARNRASFRFIFENVVRKYKNQNVVIAMHHPLYTYGPHGGRFTVKQHIFPLTDVDSSLWVPLPGIGTVAQFFRGTVGSRQDVAHQDYKDFRSAVLAGAKKNGTFIFASGHEHALEYIENERQRFIVSGSGSKNSPVLLGKGGVFGSGAAGYSTISFYKGGEAWAQFWEVNTEGTSAKLVFQKKIKDKLPLSTETLSTTFPEYDLRKDTVVRPVTKSKVEPIGGVHKFLFGEHHRDLYLEKYSFPVLDLSTFKGGVTPIKQGGGNQTNSLRVRDDKGRDYTLRAMTKDATRFLPYPFNRMVAAKFLVEDNFLATLPFAPLTVPHLAEAIDVYHTNPKIYYIPAQPGLGIYNGIFGGGVHLVEERPAGKNWTDADFFGSPEKIVSTPDVTEAILKDSKQKVDEEWAVRTRMLDFIIGDWDRHDDQWTWAMIDQPDGAKLYRPIPRDRDQAFSRYDGLAPTLARQTLPFLRQLQVYGPEINSMKWTTWSARLFDRTFLNELSWQQWETQVKFIQEHLTDEVIENAFVDWPQKARDMAAPELIESIKARRNDLMSMARTHYEFVGKSVEVIGTEDEERFEVERLDDLHTRVTVYEISKKGRVKRQTFQRTFENDITKSLELYGNGDGDEFVVKGEVRKGITVRLIGGLGNDQFTDSSFVRGARRKTLVYDDLRRNTLISGRETADKRSSVSRFNMYDRRGYDSEYDIMIPLPIIGYNPDDLFLLGGIVNWVHHGFKKLPYKSFQRIGASYAFGTRAFRLAYEADFLNVMKNWDLYLDARYHGPSYSFNFAGLGNESTRPIDDPNFYRVRQGMISLYPALKKRFAGVAGYFTLGPTFQTTNIENTSGRYISIYGTGENEHIFDHKYFAGAQLGFHYNNVDNFFQPHSGIRFNLILNWVDNFNVGENFTSIRSQLSFYKHLDPKENVVIASQIGYGQNFGQGYEFFQMPNIGGSLGLRGYRTERFYGDIAFWQSTDLRVRFSSSENRILPFTLGIFGSFDYGRVWLKGEESESWHNSLGGGVWLSPVDALIFSIGSYFPKEEIEESPRIVFKVGFGF